MVFTSRMVLYLEMNIDYILKYIILIMNIIVLDDLDQRVTQLNQRLSYAYN